MRALSLALLFATALSACSSGGYWNDRGRSSDRSERGRYDRTVYRSTRDYPRSARAGRDRYVVCHNGRTHTVPTAAVRGHLGHGDRFGACARQDTRHDGRGRGHRRGRH